MNGKEIYFSPETEIIPISIETSMLNGSVEPIGGGNDPDQPWPTSNRSYHG